MAACQTANTNTHTHTHTRLMTVRPKILDMPVHDTQRLVNTAATLFLPFFLFFSLPAVNMKVAAFNIQKFGKSKVADPAVLEILVKVTNSLMEPQKG